MDAFACLNKTTYVQSSLSEAASGYSKLQVATSAKLLMTSYIRTQLECQSVDCPVICQMPCFDTSATPSWLQSTATMEIL